MVYFILMVAAGIVTVVTQRVAAKNLFFMVASSFNELTFYPLDAKPVTTVTMPAATIKIKYTICYSPHF